MTFPPPNDANRPGSGGGFGPPPQDAPQAQPPQAQPPQQPQAQQPSQGFGPPPPQPGQPGPAGQPALPPGGGFGTFGPPSAPPGGPLPGGFPPGSLPPGSLPPSPPRGGGSKVVAIVVAAAVAVAVIVGAIALGSQGDHDSDEAAADETPRASASTSATASPSAPSSDPSSTEDPGEGAPFGDDPKGDPDSGTSPTPSQSAGSRDRVPYVVLAPGTCFDHPAMDSSVTKIEKRSCSSAHDGEVIANEKLTGDFSSETAIQKKALSLCAVDAKTRLQKIPNDGRNYYYYALYPALGTYSVQGEDKVSCALTLSSGLDGAKLHKPLPK
ncbi:hypothetical protein [Streptomyces coffeae]|uniref:Septum formation-related domain-containing protein n=1 Tax=Streptomyces coffeae TaxID=621382 RepID=A0ABS1NAH6_9ACTN|nr:hypothetical protein [Streptomyces coffeae]MBL1097082.1 hypothetical protein [Streptomyces coffeae]